MKNLRLLLLCSAIAATFLNAAESEKSTPPTPLNVDSSYKLNPNDNIYISVNGEPDLATSQRLGNDGSVRLTLIGEIKLSGMTLREAEKLLERTYIERRFLKAPLVSVTVQSYAVREVSVFGAVQNPGKISLPGEKTSIDIVDIIQRAGGFTIIARGDRVKVTRTSSDGSESSIVIDVEAMIKGRSSQKSYSILPGDRIYVPDRYL